MKAQLAKMTAKMIAYDAHDTPRIQHFLKVHELAALIGRLENLDDETLFVLETAAILHDIGIHLSEQKYGSAAGKYQEMEGPDEARKLMEQTGGFSQQQTDRVQFLVGHHHTYGQAFGIDHQILIEADFLVNIFEDKMPQERIAVIREKVFKTKSGRAILDQMF